SVYHRSDTTRRSRVCSIRSYRSSSHRRSAATLQDHHGENETLTFAPGTVRSNNLSSVAEVVVCPVAHCLGRKHRKTRCSPSSCRQRATVWSTTHLQWGYATAGVKGGYGYESSSIGHRPTPARYGPCTPAFITGHVHGFHGTTRSRNAPGNRRPLP